MLIEGVKRHTASGGEGLYTSLPSTPVWPCGHGVVHVIFSPDVSGGRRSFPSLVLRQLTCLACDVVKVFRISIKTHPDGFSGIAEGAVVGIDKKVESGQYPDAHDRGTIASFKGLLKRCDPYDLYRKTIWPVEMKIANLEREMIGTRSFRRFMETREGKI